MRFAIVAGSLALMFVMMSGAGRAQDQTEVKPAQHWSGLVNDEAKQKAAPKSGVLTSQEAFGKLWTAWGVKGEAPMIDFKKQVVFVQIGSGPNVPFTMYTLDKDGNLTAISKQTLKGGPGFGYSLDLLDRTGIKSYQGKPLE